MSKNLDNQSWIFVIGPAIAIGVLSLALLVAAMGGLFLGWHIWPFHP